MSIQNKPILFVLLDIYNLDNKSFTLHIIIFLSWKQDVYNWDIKGSIIHNEYS